MNEPSCPRCGLRECAPPGLVPDLTLEEAKAVLRTHAFNLRMSGEGTKAHAISVLIDALEAPRSTLKSAPPLTPEELALPGVGEVWRMAGSGKRYQVTRVERTEGYPWAVVYSVGQDAAGVTREMDCPVKAWFALFELCQHAP